MDRLNQLRSETAGSSNNSSLDSSSSASDYATANESSSKFFSISDVDSTLEISSEKTKQNVAETDNLSATETDSLISNLSPISQKCDNFKIGKQIEAANILSGGVDIFDDNDNSYDGDELVIDDNVAVETDDKLNVESTTESQSDDNQTALCSDNTLVDTEVAIPSKDTEVVLQIDGRNVDAFHIGNGLYLYRLGTSDDELAAVQIFDADQQQPTFKFLKVRENAEGQLVVYEEIVKVHKDLPDQDAISSEKSSSHVPIEDTNKVITDHPSNTKHFKNINEKEKSGNSNKIVEIDSAKECTESRSEVNLNGKTMKISDTCRKSPLIGSFTPMTFHSTPNKEGIPLTKTMVDLQLHPSRHNDAAKKTIEVTTDSCKHKVSDSATVNPIDIHDKDVSDCIIPNHKPDSNIGVVAVNDSEIVIEKANEVHELFDNDVLSDNKILSSNVSQIESQATIELSSPEKQEPIKGNDNQSKIVALTVKQSPDMKELVTPPSSTTDDTIRTHENSEIEELVKKENVDTGTSLTSVKSDQNKPEKINKTISKTEHLISTETNKQMANVKKVREQKDGTDFVTNATHVKEQTETISSKESIKETKQNLTKNVDTSEIKPESGIKLEAHNIKSKTDYCGSDISTSTKDTKSNITIKKSETVTSDTVKKNDNESINTKTENKIEPQKTTESLEKTKSINNNVAVPFGKWTEANKQEYLNKIKESKPSANSGSTNQIKLPKDLNRRDVLNKIDIARHNTLAAKDSQSCTKPSLKPEPNKQIAILPIAKKPEKKVTKLESSQKICVDNTGSNVQKLEGNQRTEINNQHLIDKTIEGILMDKLIAGKYAQEPNESNSNIKDCKFSHQQFDDIERKLSELHGHSTKAKILDQQDPNVKHEHEKIASETHFTPKSNKLSNTICNAPGQSTSREKSNEDDNSDEEILECEPITGDIDLHKHSTVIATDSGDLKVKPNISGIDVNKSSDKKPVSQQKIKENTEESGSVITEKDFDKFARRTSVTYENCITVNFNDKQQANVVQTIVKKDSVKMDPKKIEFVSKSHFRPLSSGNKNTIHSQIKTSSKDDESHANYTKLQLAYHTALNKRSKESPITVIEDKPVKVVFMENCSEFLPYQLNVQGQQLSSNKNFTDVLDSDTYTVSSCDSMDSDILETVDSVKSHEETKIKRHQRKQVLTPVDTPEMELIEPKDLGIVTKNKRKRKSDDSKHTRDEHLSKRSSKCLVPKKSYLLGRVPEKESQSKAACNKVSLKEEATNSDVDRTPVFGHNELVSNPIDNLVKAAELLEKQSENSSLIDSLQTSSSSTPQPLKRGRGRPRKYPVQETDKSQIASPQKKIKLDMEVTKPDLTTSDEDSDDEGIARQNWTMGKINESIVCPICNKLFRSENVVFKHVKHCSGPSPTKADSPERSNSNDYQLNTNEIDTLDTNKTDDRKNESSPIKNNRETIIDEDVILIEDSFRNDEAKTSSIKPVQERDIPNKNVNVTNTSVEHKEKEQTKISSRSAYCECCGRTFRNMTYLINHKMLHKKNVPKKVDSNSSDKSVFSCEVCRKEFRKLHHLVQHRNNHNPSSTGGPKLRRKSSVGQNNPKTPSTSPKPTDEQGAGFRCEPCDKSFRKLHHLVEHRETHDGINRLKNLSASQSTPEKTSNPPPQCDICNKTFRKLHHLIEHKEQQHVESLKTDEKSSKSTLVAKDIIHECSLCYMVFPNEHALNKHFIICQRKKKSPKLKKLENKEEAVDEQEDLTDATSGTSNDDELNISIQSDKNAVTISEHRSDNKVNDKEVHINIENEKPSEVEVKPSTIPIDNGKTEDIINNPKVSPEIATVATPAKELDKSRELLKRKTPLREKTASTVTKRSKSLRSSVNSELKVTKIDLSDGDDDVRYMFNPNYQEDATKEFLKVRANRRDSLTCVKPKNNDAIKRRISLQIPPKAPRINPKPKIPIRAKISTSKPVIRKSSEVTVPSTSDDYEIKYSFPKTPKVRKSVDTKSTNVTTKLKETKGKSPNTRDKRKTLSTKIKSPGKTLGAKTQAKETPMKQKPVKRRTMEVGHKCDCGQLFNSAALLARHTTVAHTPPRRRRLSPPPDAATAKPVPKPRRYAAHRGVPLPDKMKKLVDKLK